MNYNGNNGSIGLRTAYISVLFFLALTALTACIYMMTISGTHVVLCRTFNVGFRELPFEIWRPYLFSFVLIFCTLVVAAGSLYKFLKLRDNFIGMVENLGGRLANCELEEEQILLDVVEEVSLAAGINVPAVVVLDKEPGINAFSLGSSADNAIVGFTQGALQILNRDELQAIAAYEVQHLLSGESILNFRLLCLVHGIIYISVFGFYLCQVGSGERYFFSKEKPNSVKIRRGPLLSGIMIAWAGSFGLLFGKLVKIAALRGQVLSKDRAVAQFTNNPLALAGALKKIGGTKRRGALLSSEGEVYSHLCFTDASRYTLFKLISTHPSLPIRIKRLDRDWDGSYPEVVRHRRRKRYPLVESDTLLRQQVKKRKNEFKNSNSSMSSDSLFRLIRQPQVGDIHYIQELLALIPQKVRQILHHPNTARAAIYSLLLSDNPQARQKQVENIANNCCEVTRRIMNEVFNSTVDLPRQTKLPLVQIATNNLRLLAPDQYPDFRQNVVNLIEADGEYSIFECALQQLLLNQLDEHFKFTNNTEGTLYKDTEQLVVDSLASFALLTSATKEVESASRALKKALQHLKLESRLDPSVFSNCSVDTFANTLNQLSDTPFATKSAVLEAFVSCVTEDGVISHSEVELLRAVASTFQIYIPPIAVSEQA